MDTHRNRFFFQESDDLIYNTNVFDLKEYYGAEYYFDSNVDMVEYRGDIAVFVHLYYLDLLDYCYSFLREITTFCDVFVTTSNAEIKRSIEEKNKQEVILNCKVKLVKNQGYDIASLTVHNRNLIMQYKYFCFVHDKKSEHLYSGESGELWLQTLWENTLKTSWYAAQIIDCFENNKSLGILSVPEPYW